VEDRKNPGSEGRSIDIGLLKEEKLLAGPGDEEPTNNFLIRM
jgi:hypothetical protein